MEFSNNKDFSSSYSMVRFFLYQSFKDSELGKKFLLQLSEEVEKMAFIKVKDKKSKEEAIINTDMICRIAKSKNGYIVFFSSGNTGAAYYEYDEEEIKKIFVTIGVSLD